LVKFIFISLYQDIKRKQALLRSNLRSNLSAINILTVCSNATLGSGSSASLFVLLILSVWLRKPNPKSYGKQPFHSRLLGVRAANSYISLHRREAQSETSRLQSCKLGVVVSLVKKPFTL